MLLFILTIVLYSYEKENTLETRTEHTWIRIVSDSYLTRTQFYGTEPRFAVIKARMFYRCDFCDTDVHCTTIFK